MSTVISLTGVPLATLALLCLAALLAGWIDAVVGGGGLVQLPALLLVPGFTPVQAIATNKVSSIMGTAVSSVTYWRRIRPDLRLALPTALIALCGSFGGAVAARHIPTSVFTPIILAALVAVLVFTLARPQIGINTPGSSLALRDALLRAAPLGTVIGFYDGFMGPGTGSFLVLGLAALIHLPFIQATAMTKIVNLATNLGALLFFAPQGLVDWRVGLVIGVANMLGGYVGARTAVRLGSRFVRGVLLIVVGALIVTLGLQVAQG